ncbi:hypothetical protein FACS189445_7020 [Spirochaetia bacterium]|nr:hypothetical protein FACS189445_7020 [Spirochaetia bacterium]
MCLLLLLFLPACLHAQTMDYELLLRGYIEQDIRGEQLALGKERTALELQKYALETGIAFTVSSGNTVSSI